MSKKYSILADADVHPENITIWTGTHKIAYPIHKHKKAQFFYAEGGATFIMLKDKEYLLPARHYAWIPAGMEHHFLRKHGVHPFYTLYVPEKILPPSDFYKQMGIYPVTSLLLEMILYSKSWQGVILEGSPKFQFLSTFIQLLPELHPKSLPFSLPTTANPRLQEILRYMQSHLGVKLTLASVSKKFNYSERTFSRNFKAALGISFFQYLKMARCIRAMEMLLRTEKTVSEIAFDTGYDSISSFSNTFVALSGMRPKDFRELNG